MMFAIPPKHPVSHVVGHIKGKKAIHLARVDGEQKRHCVGQQFWARGYFVGTVGRDEAVMRDDIRNQVNEDPRLEQMGLRRRPRKPPSGGASIGAAKRSGGPRRSAPDQSPRLCRGMLTDPIAPGDGAGRRRWAGKRGRRVVSAFLAGGVAMAACCHGIGPPPSPGATPVPPGSRCAGS